MGIIIHCEGSFIPAPQKLSQLKKRVRQPWVAAREEIKRKRDGSDHYETVVVPFRSKA